MTLNINQNHVLITDTIKEHIKNLKIVFPSFYGSLYVKTAKEMNIDIEPQELISHELLDEKMINHILSLSHFTQEAIEAMGVQDENVLKNILKETKKLYQEIELLKNIIYEDTLTKSYTRKWLSDSFLNSDQKTFIKEGILVIVDINDFKHINDNFGHVIGDKVLMHISDKLKETGGHIVRYGGDEFLILFDEDISMESAKQKIKSISNYFQKITFKVEHYEFKVTFSYGIAVFTNQMTLDSTLEVADNAMYSSKKSR